MNLDGGAPLTSSRRRDRDLLSPRGSGIRRPSRRISTHAALRGRLRPTPPSTVVPKGPAMFQQHPYVLRALVAERQAELQQSERGQPAGQGRTTRAPARSLSDSMTTQIDQPLRPRRNHHHVHPSHPHPGSSSRSTGARLAPDTRKRALVGSSRRIPAIVDSDESAESATYICSGASIPSRCNPRASTRAVTSLNARRPARVPASGALSTGQCS